MAFLYLAVISLIYSVNYHFFSCLILLFKPAFSFFLASSSSYLFFIVVKIFSRVHTSLCWFAIMCLLYYDAIYSYYLRFICVSLSFSFLWGLRRGRGLLVVVLQLLVILFVLFVVFWF